MVKITGELKFLTGSQRGGVKPPFLPNYEHGGALNFE